jgi:hypothetical protein
MDHLNTPVSRSNHFCWILEADHDLPLLKLNKTHILLWTLVLKYILETTILIQGKELNKRILH